MLDKLVPDTQKVIIGNVAELPIALLTNKTIIYEPESAHIINKFLNKKVTIMLPDNDSIKNDLIYIFQHSIV